ncbi:MAG TPA: GHKL domain-containing protein, partial [Candidatus Tenderia electrophaga]|nr:GHKL domain-containing protein [Candidatus Tenderia electrophaga]
IGVLLVFATRLSMRVRRLRDEVEASVTDDGRVQNQIKSTRAGDELGDLGRSFAAMHERLTQYNRYLETMAGKLGHELRTPITIVRSSLDNLANCQTEAEANTYRQRAHEGVTRLSGILTRMSEASHLEQTIQQEETSLFCINDVLAGCTKAYALAHPQQPFEFDDTTTHIQINGSPDLIAQMLDKLISNALDFGKKDTAIVISLQQQSGNVVISVANQGPPLPQQMRANLFDSMVSIRQGKSDQPHLGLGLYIVRLIAEHHHGHVQVDNLDDDKGVVFSVVLPLS